VFGLLHIRRHLEAAETAPEVMPFPRTAPSGTRALTSDR